MRFGKPYPRDYRRPQEAEERLQEALERALKGLEVEGCDVLGIGFVDEASPQTTANTVRVWSFGKPTIIKNTKRLKANAIGFYPLKGKAVAHFGEDSKEETFIEFLKVLREENHHYKAILVIEGGGRGQEAWYQVALFTTLLPRLEPHRVHLEEHKAHYLPHLR